MLWCLVGQTSVCAGPPGPAAAASTAISPIRTMLLGTREWFVIHHTNCGMLFFTNEIMRDLLSKSLQTAALVDGVWKDSERGPASRAAEYIEWLTIRDQTQSVIDDVERIKSHPSFRAKSRFTVRLRRRDGSAERGCSS